MPDAPWFALSIDYWRNPKVARAGFLAASLNIAALAYCAEQLTDGFVPEGVVHILAAPMQHYVYDPGLPKGAICGPGTEHEDGIDLANRLEDAGLWMSVSGGWQIVNYLDHQPSREQVEARRERAREAGRKGGQAKSERRGAKPTASDSPSDSLSTSLASGLASASDSGWHLPGESPSESVAPAPAPIPTELQDLETSSSPLRGDGFDEFWQVYPRREGKKAAEKAWAKATKTTTAERIIGGAARFRDDPNREPAYTPHPTTWLNQGRWDDEPLPVRLRAVPSRVQEQDDMLRGWYDQAVAGQMPELGA